MRRKCRLCGEQKDPVDFPTFSNRRLPVCSDCAISEINLQKKTGRESVSPRYRKCRHCRKKKKIERFPARVTPSGMGYRSYTCSTCCSKGLEWKPSRIVRSTLNAKWLDDPIRDEQDPWLNQLAASIALDKERSED